MSRLGNNVRIPFPEDEALRLLLKVTRTSCSTNLPRNYARSERGAAKPTDANSAPAAP
jgi:hypothetical protein